MASTQKYLGAATPFGTVVHLGDRVYNPAATVEHRDGTTGVCGLPHLIALGVTPPTQVVAKSPDLDVRLSVQWVEFKKVAPGALGSEVSVQSFYPPLFYSRKEPTCLVCYDLVAACACTDAEIEQFVLSAFLGAA